MLRSCLKRLAIGIGMLIALSMLVFVLLRLTPGDPIDAYIDPSTPLSPAAMADLRDRLGLDQPLPVQYIGWLQQALHGNFGYSIKRLDQPVLTLVLSRIGPTLLLMGSALIMAIVAGIAAGVIGAVRRNSVTDVSLSVLALAGISSPAFLSALLGLYIFAVRLGWLPSGGMLTPGVDFSLGDLLRHLILPSALLAVAQAALIMRYMRASLLEVLNQGRDRVLGYRQARSAQRFAACCHRHRLDHWACHRRGDLHRERLQLARHGPAARRCGHDP
jgi:peptide/nickel transport system permease protein